MKRSLLVVLLVGIIFTLTGCATDTPALTPEPAPTSAPEPVPGPEPEPVPPPMPDMTARPGTEFHLPLGQTAQIDGTELYVTFTEVLADSRCPRGAQCPSAGRVTVRLKFTDDTSSGEIEIFHFGLTSHLRGEVWNGHHFEFQVAPHPLLDLEFDPASYYLVLKFTG